MLNTKWFGVFFLCLWPAWVPAAWAATGDAGTESLFALGVDARAAGLGRAYTGVADDASAIYWNPGALAYLDRKELDALYVPLYDGTDYGFLSFAYPIAPHEVLGLGLMGVSTRDIPKTDQYDTDQGSFSDLQMQALLSYSRVWWRNLAAGINLKFYYHALDNYTGTGVGLDGGVYYDARDFLPGLTLGATATNALSPRITLISEPDVYPLNLRLGAAYCFSLDVRDNHRLLVTAEGEKSEYLPAKAHAGLEYQGFKLAALRAGWDQDHPTVGAGLMLWDLRLDYALAFQGNYGNLNLISLNWQFGASLAQAEAERKLAMLAELILSKSREANQHGLDFLTQRKYEQATEEFEKALSWVGESAEISENLKQAQSAWRKQRAEKQVQNGQKYYLEGHYLEALLAWQTASKLDPQYPGLGPKLKAARDSLESRFTPQRQKNRRQPTPSEQESLELFRSGLSYYLDSKFSVAVQEWEKALKLNPDLPDVKEYLAKAWKQLQPDERHLGTPTPTVSQRQESEQVYTMGLLQYRQQRFADARDFWKKALEIDPTNANARRGLERVESIIKVLGEKSAK